MAKHIQGDSIGKKSLLVLLKLVSLPSIVHRSLALLISILLLSDSVAATPGQMGVRIAQQPAATEQDATRAAAERILQEGVQLFKQGTAESLRQAIAKWEEALALYRVVGDRAGEASILLGIGRVFDNLGENQKALDYYNQALLLKREVGDKAGEADTLFRIGKIYSDLGQNQKALEFYNQALPLWQTIGVKGQEAHTLIYIAIAYNALGEKQKALDYYNQSLPLWRTVGDKRGEILALLVIAKAYSDLGQKQKALEYYNQSLPLVREVGEKFGEAVALNNIGNVYSDLGEKQKALEYYNQALPLRREVGDKKGEAETINSIGNVYSDLGEKQKALEYYNQALPLRREVNNKEGEAETINSIGNVYSNLGEKQKALEYYNQSLPLRREVNDKKGEAVTINNIGLVYSDLGDKQKALEYYNEALLLFREMGDKEQEATALNNIGSIYSALGEKQKALEFYNQSLPLSRATGDRAGEATSLNNIGTVYNVLGEKQKALDYFNQSLLLLRTLGYKTEEASSLSNIGSIYSDLGEKQKALDYFNQSLPLRREVGDKAGEAITLNNIGLLYSNLGEYQKALDYFNQSLPLRQAIRDKAGEATTLSNIGEVYSDLGQKQTALDYHNQALPLTRATGDKVGEANTLINIGEVYSDLGQKQTALDYYNQALPLTRATGDKTKEAITLNNIGIIYSDLGQKQQALNYFNQSWPLRRATGDKAGEATTLSNIGAVYDHLGQKQKALKFYNQALPLSRTAEDKEQEAATLFNVAYLERNQGNLNVAQTQIEAAIEILEKLRTNIASQELRASYFATVQDYYQFYIDLLMQLHKTNPSKGYDALALNASERVRARNLLEILFEANADIRQGADAKLVEQERTLQQQLNATEYQKFQLLKGQYTNKQLADIQKDIESLLTQLDEVQAQIRVKSPNYAALTQPQAFTLTLPEIQKEVLDDNTLLLEYSLGEERSYLWAVTKTGITSYELPKRADIEAAAQDFYQQLNSSQEASPEVGMKLSQMLLAPVANQLGQKRLLIVSDGALQYIPFAALPIPENNPVSLLSAPHPEINLRANSPSRLKTTETPITSPLQRTSAISQGFKPLADVNSYTPLVVNHEIVSLPSASTLAVLRRELKDRKPAPKTLVAIADPVFTPEDDRLKQASEHNNTNTSIAEAALKRSATDIGIILDRLKYSRTEAEQILALVPENQRSSAFDFTASRTTATSPNLAEYRMVHLATHGLLNSLHPELSGVVLSLVDENGKETDGFLRLHDIYNLNLPAELVVLSACETGIGKDVKGEGLVSLTRGFMYAGAKRVAVSLWSVNDTATASLMTKFYQQMLEKGLNPVAALRAAQLEMLKTEQWKAPYYWAAFVVQGEWR